MTKEKNTQEIRIHYKILGQTKSFKVVCQRMWTLLTYFKSISSWLHFIFGWSFPFESKQINMIRGSSLTILLFFYIIISMTYYVECCYNIIKFLGFYRIKDISDNILLLL